MNKLNLRIAICAVTLVVACGGHWLSGSVGGLPLASLH